MNRTIIYYRKALSLNVLYLGKDKLNFDVYSLFIQANLIVRIWGI